MNVDINGGITQVQETDIYTDFFSSFYNLDNSGNLYIGDSRSEYKITKYNCESATLDWEYKKPIAITTGNWARLNTIEFDEAGNTYCGGFYYIDTIGIRVGLVTKLDVEGKLVWEDILSITDSVTAVITTSQVVDSLIVFAGTNSFGAVKDDFYQSFIATYEHTGIQTAGLVTFDGSKNLPTCIEFDSSCYYIGGVFSGEQQFISGYFLGKLNRKSPVKTLTAPKELIQSITLYPNPFYSILNVGFENSGKGTEGKMIISDNLGRVIYDKELYIHAGNNSFDISELRNYPSGVYTLFLIVDGTLYPKQFVKK